MFVTSGTAGKFSIVPLLITVGSGRAIHAYRRLLASLTETDRSWAAGSGHDSRRLPRHIRMCVTNIN